jgi:acetyl esterase
LRSSSIRSGCRKELDFRSDEIHHHINPMSIVPHLILFLATALNAQIGAESKTPAAYSRQPDAANVSYGPHARHMLDLWKAPSSRPTPLVVYFNPGGFSAGDKTWIETFDNASLREMCLERGISVATANYRYAAQAHLPAAMLDCARAIQFLRLHAKEYNLDPRAVIAAGSSAGAATALWLAFHDDLADPHSDDPVSRQSTRVSAVGSLAGQTTFDLAFLTRLCGEALGHRLAAALYGMKPDELTTEAARKRGEEISPITYLTRDDPPVFLYYSADLSAELPPPGPQAIHNPRFGVLLKEQMDKLGVECILRTPKDYAGGGNHAMAAELVDFFQKHFTSASSHP